MMMDKSLPSDRAAKARQLLAAGVSLRAVLLECGISQADLMRAAGLTARRTDVAGDPRRGRFQPRVSHILAHPDAPPTAAGAQREGAALAQQVYRAAAHALGIKVKDIPEARWVVGADPGVVTGGRRRHTV